MYALQAMREAGLKSPLHPPVEALITFVVASRRRRDYDNMLGSIKALFDGLQDAGVLQDDSAWMLHLTLAIELGAQAVHLKLTGSPQASLL